MALGEGSFRVEIDRHDGRYRAGEKLRGQVSLSGVDDSVRGVDVKLRWYTSGEGNSNQHDAATLRLPVSARGSVKLPFELDLPLGPVSYQGHLIQVGWALVVSVDVAWAKDPEKLVLLSLLPADPQRVTSGGGGIYRESSAAIYRAPSTPVRHELGHTTQVAGKVKGKQYLGGFAALAGMAAIGTLFDGVGFLMAPLAGIGALAVAYVGIRHTLTRSSLGSPTVGIVPTEARRGEVVRARIHLRPRLTLSPMLCRAELKGIEQAVKGSGSSSTTHTHTLYHQHFALVGPSPLAANQDATLEAEVKIPDDAAPTFGSLSNDVIWTIKIEFNATTPAGGHVAYDEEIVLHVQPS